jgi:acyl-CoA synthetase (AMP-forming)/AMP-acid ligase II
VKEGGPALAHRDQGEAGTGAQDDDTAVLRDEHLDAGGLSRFDMPEYCIGTREIPLTTSGKILKRELVNWVRQGRVRPRPIRWHPKS